MNRRGLRRLELFLIRLPGVLISKSRSFFSRYEIRDPHLVEENVLQVLKERADFDNYKPRPFNMREFYDRTGHDIKDMLLSCYYRGMECSAEDFKVVSQACQRLNVLCRASWGPPRRERAYLWNEVSANVVITCTPYDLCWAVMA